MYCPSCGVSLTQGLPYCNYCGAKLGRGESGDKTPDIRSGGLITMMVATFVMGLFAITIFMGVMKTVVRLETAPLLAFVLLSFLVMLLLEDIFIFLLFRRAPRGDYSREVKDNRASTKELEAESRVPMEPIASVTEHTTRAFDHVYSERK
ncbi:MAG: hypothetical protein ABR607_05965 [Pyrinomonadaceae bacterium]